MKEITIVTLIFENEKSAEDWRLKNNHSYSDENKKIILMKKKVKNESVQLQLPFQEQTQPCSAGRIPNCS